MTAIISWVLFCVGVFYLAAAAIRPFAFSDRDYNTATALLAIASTALIAVSYYVL
jgi:hypothetical protein